MFTPTRITCLALLCVATGALAAPQTLSNRPTVDATLSRIANQAFAAATLDWPGRRATIGENLVEITRADAGGRWIAGSITAIMSPQVHESPKSLFFVAQRVGNSWQLAVEGSPQYSEMLAAAPADLIEQGEKTSLLAAATLQMDASDETGLSLPWKEGVAWYMGGGPHGNSGNSRPFNSIDFNGGDGQVLAPAAGRFYRTCVRNGSALVKLVHDNGYTTTYYHMTNLGNYADGTRIDKGTYLGRIGVQLPCGGSASGAHVHFSLQKDGRDISVNSKIIGGWQFTEGSRAYGGYATHAGQRVGVGGSLRNYGGGSGGGTIPPKPGAVEVLVQAPNPNQPVNLRERPSLSATILATAKHGDRVRIVCYQYGDAVQGMWGQTRLWNKLETGQWVNDGFLDTGSNDPVVPQCS
ncbi:peptidoglycan DD-metalloendopeptidase family protein [Parachitinimonas caeni]|uniref:Peptidoglycan DD-metalloendopeptidase family protein n=1 Tax=Parachitinimonas caeni TaxID=3031301 RepID=A0ABT7DW80_9NEIS|nr:peptidoglycan DD-metalloendopeptidase family protein [Parachitinimonas caeni]MDK2124322.1 peptidoglycan DD-metalloendopeptidase family protein [Parachitinimonas caeni]